MAGSGHVWYHKHLGRMETEKLLMESKEDGSFLVRESDTVKGAFVLSIIYQKRIHHYRILTNDEGKLSIQAQQGVQRRQFLHIEDLVVYYSYSRRGLVCALTIPITQKKEEEAIEDPDDSDDDGEGDHEKNIVSKFLLASLSTVDTSKVEDGFLDQVRSYLNKDVTTDIDTMSTQIPQLFQLKQLFNKDCVVLHRQLDKMMGELDLMKSLFERAGGAKHGSAVVAVATNRKSTINDMDYNSLSYKLEDCTNAISGLENTAFQMLRELSVSMTGGQISSLSMQLPDSCRSKFSLPRDGVDSEEIIFDVKLDQGLQGKKNVNILVNLKECQFHFYKPGETQRTKYEHHQLLQLMKSHSRDTNLTIVFKGQGQKEYIFNDMRSREHFCQLTQLIRNRMRAGEDQDQDIVSVFVGSWNMGDVGPPIYINSWIQSLGLGKTLPTALSQAHDLYAFGTQEANITEKEWITKLRQTLKQTYDIDYEKVACQTLWGMRCLILTKPEHMNKIAHVQTSSAKTGIGNALGNKGGVGISFFFGSISLCFICSHLTSGNEKCSRRNQNYHDILRGMGNLKQKKLNQFDLTNNFAHLFFFGDLNYRVDMGATEIVQHAKNSDHYAIYNEDQLRKEKEKKMVLVGFDEEVILFPPTYRFMRDSRTLDDYVWVKKKRSGIRINVPSYCDRVLWKSYPGTSIVNTSYGCSNDIMTSDHSPVFATFQLHGFKQYVCDSGLEEKNKCAIIVVESCNAKIATTSKTNFYIEFFSSCSEGLKRTGANNDWRHVSGESDPWPIWKSREPLALIRPIITEENYLEQQHLLVMFKSQEGDEPYAECCLSLRGVIGSEPKKMASELIHQGHYVGQLEIMIHVKLDTYRNRKAEEDLYSDVNFITQEPISLDKPGATRHGRSPSSDLDNVSVVHRSKLPSTQPSVDWVRSLNSSQVSPIPPPLPPSRRNLMGLPMSGMTGPLSKHMRDPDSLPPPLPSAAPGLPMGTPKVGEEPVPLPRTRRSENFGHRNDNVRTPDFVDKSLDCNRLRGMMIAANASAPVRWRQVPNQIGLRAKDPPPSSGPQGPPIPTRRPGLARPQPFSSIDSFLMHHGLQHYSECLKNNGYDDPQFLADVSDKELLEIGIVQAPDREKLLKVFKNFTPSH